MSLFVILRQAACCSPESNGLCEKDTVADTIFEQRV